MLAFEVGVVPEMHLCAMERQGAGVEFSSVDFALQRNGAANPPIAAMAAVPTNTLDVMRSHGAKVCSANRVFVPPTHQSCKTRSRC